MKLEMGTETFESMIMNGGLVMQTADIANFMCGKFHTFLFLFLCGARPIKFLTSIYPFFIFFVTFLICKMNKYKHT